MSLYSALRGIPMGNPDKDESFYDKMSSDQLKICNMIGLLACDIRGDWRDVDDRLDAIIELCERVGMQEWIDEIDDNKDDIYYDGRWFRDCWSGPYEDDGSIDDVGQELYDEFYSIFSHPENYFT
jgi:hypothetical protein